MEAAKRLPTPAPNCHADPLSTDAEEYDGTLTMRNSSENKATHAKGTPEWWQITLPAQLSPEEREITDDGQTREIAKSLEKSPLSKMQQLCSAGNQPNKYMNRCLYSGYHSRVNKSPDAVATGGKQGSEANAQPET